MQESREFLSGIQNSNKDIPFLNAKGITVLLMLEIPNMRNPNKKCYLKMRPNGCHFKIEKLLWSLKVRWY